MNPLICLSLTTSTFSECLKVARGSEMLELRLDLMQATPQQVQQLLRLGVPTVATCREGRHSQAERLQLLQLAIREGATCVDVEVEADEAYRHALIATARAHGCKVIVSYHNFEETPALTELRRVGGCCRRQGADVVKLVTTARAKQDCARLLSLYGEDNSGSLVAFAMGSIGKITRVACLYLGAPFTYAAAAEGSEAAPGQMTAGDMQTMMALMRSPSPLKK
ncbi:MAG: type I 3-dehydroquinate dehydratase [Prevotellaceae bacterium]|jgi:3-dehydroquinate dehydratase type I|nr:type I 3-dehydroquinate dehydratase [Prevotellaceae bacterium]